MKPRSGSILYMVSLCASTTQASPAPRCHWSWRHLQCSIGCRFGVGTCSSGMQKVPSNIKPPSAWNMVRLYDDGQESHWGEVSFPFTGKGGIGYTTEMIPCKGVWLRWTGGKYNFDWHHAPRRQLIASLNGHVRAEVGSGERRDFGPGELLLVEDTKGQGHRTWTLDGADRWSVFIALDDEGAWTSRLYSFVNWLLLDPVEMLGTFTGAATVIVTACAFVLVVIAARRRLRRRANALCTPSMQVPLWPGRAHPCMRIYLPPHLAGRLAPPSATQAPPHTPSRTPSHTPVHTPLDAPTPAAALPRSSAHRVAAFVVFRGGGWRTCAGSGEGTAAWAASQGMVGVEVEYAATEGAAPPHARAVTDKGKGDGGGASKGVGRGGVETRETKDGGLQTAGGGAVSAETEGAKALLEVNLDAHGDSSSQLLPLGAGESAYPQCVADCARAVRLVREMGARGDLPVDGARVVTCGYSAGGYISAILAIRGDALGAASSAADDLRATHSCRPDRAVLCYAVTSLVRENDPMKLTEAFTHLLGPTVQRTRRERLSPTVLLREATMPTEAGVTGAEARVPPLFIWTTADDPIVPCGHSLELFEAAREANVAAELHVYGGDGELGAHGQGLAGHNEVLRGWSAQLLAWLGPHMLSP